MGKKKPPECPTVWMEAWRFGARFSSLFRR
jgi:hypothetical protein